MRTVELLVSYDPTLVSPDFMAEHIAELEGVAEVRIGSEVGS